MSKVARLKQQPGKDMLISGSITLAQSLIDARMVDEDRLVLCPDQQDTRLEYARLSAGPVTVAGSYT